MRITGVMVQYYISCHRELWFYAHGINMNYEDSNIEIGRLIHETTFKREKKNIIIDDTIAIDFATSKDGVIVFEIKKSSKLPEPAKYQTLYYLYYLKEMGIDAKGVLVYPKERKREAIELTEENQQEMKEILQKIEEIVN
ncbi:MAG: CRISPR-associated protein Cas4, partial [Candidatus Thorarchaeota archaeon]|nr:CRISPR-associated protein Cas4 [Candidatus Thorarchaeota archaeon]